MKKRFLLNRAALAAPALIVLCASPAHAQFGNFLQQIQQMQKAVPAPGGAPSATPALPGLGGNVGQGQRARQGMPEQWCDQLTGTLRGMRIDTAVIASEFNIANLESLQDEFLKALQRKNISKTFPDAQFFRSTFETRKVRGIYDTFLAFPEPETLAALIQLSRSGDRQEAGDASMALTFLHLQAPHLSVNPNKGRDWVQRMLGLEHYTAQVFRARVYGYGEMAGKNLQLAASAMQRAGSLDQSYRQSGGDGGMRMEYDPQNYGVVLLATARDLLRNEPNFPYRSAWESQSGLSARIAEAQRAYGERFPRTAVGKTFLQAAALNLQVIEMGNQLITSSQGGNQLAGQLASLESLKSSQQGERQTFAYMHPEAHASQLRLMSRVGQLGPEQRQLAAQAQELRVQAQGMLFNASSVLAAESLANATDFVRAAANLEGMRAANDGLIQSCVLTTKWEQALRARDVPPVDKVKVAADVGRKTSSYKDD